MNALNLSCAPAAAKGLLAQELWWQRKRDFSLSEASARIMLGLQLRRVGGIHHSSSMSITERNQRAAAKCLEYPPMIAQLSLMGARIQNRGLVQDVGVCK